MLNNQAQPKTTVSERKLQDKAIKLIEHVLSVIDSEESFLDSDNTARNLAAIQALLDDGADPSLCVKMSMVSGRTNAIIIAAGSSSHECLQLLLESPLANANVIDSSGDSAMSYALERGETDRLRQLIPFADLNLSNKHGNTALMLAVYYENFEACGMLAKGSDLTRRNKKGSTAMTMAENSTIEIRNFLQSEADRQALDESCPHGQDENTMPTPRLRL